MHQEKLNLCQPISASYESRASVFTIVGMVSEGTEEVDYLIHLISLMYYYRKVGGVGSSREKVIVDS